MTRQLRDYQDLGCDSFTDAWDEGILRPAAVLATGLGKTDMIARIATKAADEGKRVLAIAHRGELLDQITERCKMHAPLIPVGRVQAGRNESRRPITVAMAPTLASESRRARLRKPDLVIVDECHHAASPSQMAILQWAGSFDHTPTMGVTATMVRGDKRGLGDVWQKVVFERDIRWAITHGPSAANALKTAKVGRGAKRGWLVAPRGRAVVVTHMDLSSAKVSRGDYQDGELGEMVAQDVDQIVKAWQAHASDRLTVAFTPSVDSAKLLAEEFRAAGVSTGEVYGSTSAAERGDASKGTGVYGDLATGRIRVLVSVMVTTEGWDCPPVSCILMARPTRLPGLYQQIVGRGLRQSPETGKVDCLVLDVVGASRGQKLVTLVDLHESAIYDTEELDALPCSVCGGALRGQPLTEAAPHQCTCVAEEAAERDPDGGRIKLIGPAEYEDVDFFATSELNWLFTRQGTRFLPAGDRMALLWPEGEKFLAGHCTVRGYENGLLVGRDGKWLNDAPLPMNEARQLAEAWAAAFEPSVATRAASWRKRGGPPSDAQIRMAQKLRIPAPETFNKARLSDEISIVLASWVIDK